MLCRIFCFLCVTLIINTCGQFAAYADEDTAAAKFTALHKAWNSLDAALTELIQEFPRAGKERREELRTQCEQHAQRAKELMPQLRSTALAAYEEAPNKTEAVTEVLLGLAASDISRDDYAAAAEIIGLLAKHDCQDKRVDGLIGTVAYCRHDFDTAEERLKKARENGALHAQAISYLSQMDQTKQRWATEQRLRALEARADDLPRVQFETSKGTMVLELFENEAPQAVANFISLVDKRYYDGLVFHRVLPNFMAQGGCPKGDGTGGPGYTIFCECHKEGFRGHFAGSLSMAHAGRDTGGSQFFLTFRPTPHLDGKHTVFGRVIKGLEILSQLQRVDPHRTIPEIQPDKIVKATVLRKRDHVYEPTKVDTQEPPSTLDTP